jgi:DNA-binding PadR family transcriptional regulator
MSEATTGVTGPPGLLGYALLGLLARGSCSGYDLASQLRDTAAARLVRHDGLGTFWQARHSQIYPELVRLEAMRLVSFERVEQHDRPDKKVYSLSRRGRELLMAWVTSPFEAAPTRDELALRTYSVWLVEPLQAAPLFTAQAQLHRDQLAAYQTQIELAERQDALFLNQPDAPEFSNYAILRWAAALERTMAEWCSWMAERLLAARVD